MDNYETAESFSVSNDDIVDSTFNEASNRHGRPQVELTNGSEDLSFEQGRGGRPHRDSSSNYQINLDNDSRYSITCTPPGRPRQMTRVTDAMTRREAAARNASSKLKRRVVSDNVARLEEEDATATAAGRNTRFTRRPQATTNRVTSATHTGNSFLLPDMANITELVSGGKKAPTPAVERTRPSRSRFTSNGKGRADHTNINQIPVPKDEKAILNSLQLLQDKVAALERERTITTKRAAEYEAEITTLRARLQEIAPETLTRMTDDGANDKRILEAAINVLQGQQDRAQRKFGAHESAMKKVEQERDELIAQVNNAYYNFEELKAENEAIREDFEDVRAENQGLLQEVDSLKARLSHLEGLLNKQPDAAVKVARQVQKLRERNFKQFKEPTVTQEQPKPKKVTTLLDMELPGPPYPPKQGRANSLPAVIPKEDNTRDLTYVSTLGQPRVTGLRKKLEVERVVDRGNQQAASGAVEEDLTNHSNTSRRLQREQASAQQPSGEGDQRQQHFEQRAEGVQTADPTTTDSRRHTTIPLSLSLPVPASQRELDPDITTATVRPSQPPAQALASVLAKLEDEIADLKLKLSAQERRFAKADPALSKRQRNFTKARMEELIQVINEKSDIVYDLYDVLEGQGGAQARERRFARCEEAGKEGEEGCLAQDGGYAQDEGFTQDGRFAEEDNVEVMREGESFDDFSQEIGECLGSSVL
ncbi:hypothetical protein K470DRAFT_257812 [Piedraia hortae CBS 480.64]|uniref:Cep57 centrosome microtubule-binding domain-containing protein n=1 Tax=Piedraia hortae CBS 480.64 TaxID=1314780 RepID=A0A6A7BZA2_9PEZI|nr:hypothetical protein K470DRAFT_257812 [Piedraia hortae CBS 480.64]